MKFFSLFIVACTLQLNCMAQKKLVKDIDNDKINDTVYVDMAQSKVIAQISSQKFIPLESKTMEILNETSGIKPTKNGFEFYNDWMRAGYACQFRYDVKTQKIQLIGMSRYEFGNAMNDGSGESSINLVTGDYIGNWNYYSDKLDSLVSIPTAKTKMDFGRIYLEDFSDATYFDFGERCSALYERNKQTMIRKGK